MKTRVDKKTAQNRINEIQVSKRRVMCLSVVVIWRVPPKFYKNSRECEGVITRKASRMPLGRPNSCFLFSHYAFWRQGLLEERALDEKLVYVGLHLLFLALVV